MNYLLRKEATVGSARQVIKDPEIPGARLVISTDNGALICYICEKCKTFVSKNKFYCRLCMNPFAKGSIEDCEWNEMLIETSQTGIPHDILILPSRRKK